MDINVVEAFESWIEDYNSQLTDEYFLKISKILEMPFLTLRKFTMNSI